MTVQHLQDGLQSAENINTTVANIDRLRAEIDKLVAKIEGKT
nr:hypothetical protein [uncultured Aggregatibacter sp.]